MAKRTNQNPRNKKPDPSDDQTIIKITPKSKEKKTPAPRKPRAPRKPAAEKQNTEDSKTPAKKTTTKKAPARKPAARKVVSPKSQTQDQTPEKKQSQSTQQPRTQSKPKPQPRTQSKPQTQEKSNPQTQSQNRPQPQKQAQPQNRTRPNPNPESVNRPQHKPVEKRSTERSTDRSSDRSSEQNKSSNTSKSTASTPVQSNDSVKISQTVGILIDGNNIEMSLTKLTNNKSAVLNYDTVIPKLLNGRGLNRLIYFREGRSISKKLADRLHTHYFGSVVPCHKSADIPLSINATQLADKVDTIIILSGDSDYVELVRHLKYKGVRVEIAAIEITTASILKDEADYYHPITRADAFILK